MHTDFPSTRFLWISDIHMKNEFLARIKPDIWKATMNDAIKNAEKCLNDDNTPYNRNRLEKLSKRRNEFDSLVFEDKQNEPLKKFFDSLISEITTIYKQNSFEYIILSGDIAFSGEKIEYHAFFEIFLQPLHEKLNQAHPSLPFIEILIVPGNHDVKWESINEVFEEVYSISDLGKRFAKKGKFLYENIASFQSLFGNYSNALENYNKKLEKFNFPDSLFYFKKDDNRKIKINCLNSSWYSFGVYASNIISSLTKVDKLTHGNIEKAIANAYIMAEQGGQIIGTNLFTHENKADLYSHKHYTTFTIMHHPLNWMEWHERYTYNQNDTKDTLEDILKESDFLLNGHEHLPIGYFDERVSERCVQIKAGMLIDGYNPDAEHPFPCSCFSILELHKTTLTEIRYQYINMGKNKYKWTIQNEKEHILNRQIAEPLDADANLDAKAAKALGL